MKKKNTKKINKTHYFEFYSKEMHCGACELLVEKKLSKYPLIEKVDADLATKKVKVWGNINKDSEELAKDLTALIEKDGYTLTTQKEDKKSVNWNDFKIAVPVAGVIIALFITLQKIGVLNTLNPESISLPAVFLIGIIASLSSCMAVVGGLVLSISANYAKEESKAKSTKAIALFHASRIFGFFVLGGFLGFLGTAFSITHVVAALIGILILALVFGLIKSDNYHKKLSISLFTGIITYILLVNVLDETFARFSLSLITGLVMVILALNMLDIFDFTKKLQFRMPKSLSRNALNTDNIGNLFTPLLLGIATFFLPCGFTQSMQFQALATGSFLRGALLMSVFALGTFPVLAGLSFISNNFLTKNTKNNNGVFFKTAGLIVLFFSIINISGALVVLGLIKPIINF